MDLCSQNHDEICYEGRECPVCLLKEDRDYFEEECSKLESKIQKLEDEIIELQNRE